MKSPRRHIPCLGLPDSQQHSTALMDGNFVDARRSTLMMSVGGEISWKRESVACRRRKIAAESSFILQTLSWLSRLLSWHDVMRMCLAFQYRLITLRPFLHRSTLSSAHVIFIRCVPVLNSLVYFTRLLWQLRSTVRELENMRTQLWHQTRAFLLLVTAAAMINLTFWLLPLPVLRRWEMNSTISHRVYE